jgi:hypothetical protein
MSTEPAFEHDYPTAETIAALYDEMDYQRAVQAYIWATSLVNMVAWTHGCQRAGVSVSEPSLLVFDQPVSAKQGLLTANAEVVYGLTMVDLAQTGPLVIDAPAGLIGAIIDAWQRAIGDIGLAGAAKYLLAGPGQDVAEPEGHTVIRSRTSLVHLGVRGVLPQGSTDTGPFVELVSSLGIHPLAAAADPRSPRIIRNGDRPFDGDWPRDEQYFALLAEGLSHVEIEPEDKLMYAMLEPLGITARRPFEPDDRIRAILARAAATGSAMVTNMAYANRFPNRRLWADRQWEHITFATSPAFVTDTKVEVDERAQAWYQVIGNQQFLYTAKPTPGVGTWYASTFRAGDGSYLDGTNHYTLHLAADPPARQFWSLTTYDARTRAMINNTQGRASISSYQNLTINPDGSVDLHFGPEPPASGEANWVQTLPGHGFFAMFRLYGPLEPALDGTWELNDLHAAERSS